MSREKIEDGGPAFPKPLDPYPNVQGTASLAGAPGMSLRDYAAIHADVSKLEFDNLFALASFVGEAPPASHDMGTLLALSAKAVAKARYIYADAVLAARTRKLEAE